MKKYKILRAGRVLTGWVFLTLFASAGSGFAVPWMAKGALVPSIVAGSLWAAGFWILAAWLGGRFYCASFCPLGVFQDVAALCRKRYPKRRNPGRIRYAVLVFAVVAAAAGWIFPLAGLDPYSVSGRFGDRLLRPAAVQISEFLWGTLRWSSVTPQEAHTFSWVIFLWTAGVFAAIFILALWRGRWYCDTVCPAGTLLGIAAKKSRFRLQTDRAKCVRCGKCEKLCRTGAIDIKGNGIDFSRCVLCLECAAACPAEAVFYGKTLQKEPEDTPAQPSRREFLAAAGIAGAAAVAGLVGKKGKTAPDPMPVMPPGAGDFASFHARCTGCGLCASACPGKTLTPAVLEYGLSGIGQMRLSFELGKCEFECHRCSDVCPAGALKPMTLAAKQRRKIGQVTFRRDLCVVVRNGQDCGACAEHCPTGALQMVPYKGTLTVPSVLPDLCIGCGSCHYICPVRPVHAMTVTGVAKQIETPDSASVLNPLQPQSTAENDFPF